LIYQSIGEQLSMIVANTSYNSCASSCYARVPDIFH